MALRPGSSWMRSCSSQGAQDEVSLLFSRDRRVVCEHALGAGG
ncbi:MAG: hypothetical protein ABSA18_16075 [Dehalococcoidia bacterium]